MNILHVLSQFEVTGAETYAATLANYQIRSAHRVTIVSDTFHTPTEAEVVSMPVGNRSFTQRLRNIRQLSSLIREKHIDVVHAHSRAASWVAYFATKGGTTALVSTVHGRQHVHFSSRLFDIYGEKIIAVCESIRDHLIRDLSLDPGKIDLVRNPIDVSFWQTKTSINMQPHKKILSFVGRLSGPKGEVLRNLLESTLAKIMVKYPQVEFHVVGGMKDAGKFMDSLEESTHVQSSVQFLGHSGNMPEVYQRSELVVGSGRVAMEALASGTPVIAVGESNYIGLVSESTKDNALRTNFGDTGDATNLPHERIIADISNALEFKSHDNGSWGRNFVETEFNVENISRKISIIYAEACARKRHVKEIPVLMYHRVTNGVPPGSKFGIYVTTEDLDKQLGYLRRKQFTTLTLFDIQNIIRGNRIFPRKPVVLTFDDGYEDNFQNLFPLLMKYEMKAVIFLIGNPEVTTNHWDVLHGEPEVRLLNDNQIAQMRSYGIEFGSHTMNHNKLTDISFQQARNEIVQSKKIIERRIGTEIISFAYPYGALNEQIKCAVKEAGYAFGIATDSGTRNFWSDLYHIRRIPVFPATSVFTLWKKTSGRYHQYKGVA